MIYHCDALLDTPARYASLKFRRYSRWFRPTRLGWDDAVELVAFVETIGPKAAAFVFHWSKSGVKAYARLARHMVPQIQDAIDANAGSLAVQDGLDVLKAMFDGGYVSHGLPKIVKQALSTLHADGMSYAAIGRHTGLSIYQVSLACGRRNSRKVSRAVSYGALGL